MLFGDKIKELREEQGLLQRQLAAFLEIDTPMFSKIERGDRRAKREQVIKLAEYLHQDEKEILLSDKNKLKALYLFIHRCCSRFTYPWAWFSVLNCKHYKMCLF